MPVRDALALQIAFKDDLKKGGVLEGMLDTFEQSQRGILDREDGNPYHPLPNRNGRFAPVKDGGVPYRPLGLAEYFRWAVDQSLAFYIDRGMAPLVTAAAETMPPEPLLASDMPTTHGFLLIPGGLSQVDVRGQLMIHNVVFWAVTQGGVDIWYLSNKYEERDSINIAHQKIWKDMSVLPLLTLAHYTRIEFGKPLPRSLGGRKVLPPEVTEKIRVTAGPNGEIAWFWPEGYDMEVWTKEIGTPMQDPTATWLVTAWRLMQQTLVKVSEEEVDRHVRRQARRINLRSDKVTVITLRRMAGVEGEGDAEVIWSHRFWRRGHWRMTWVGPLKGEPDERYQRAVWISPTIVNKDREDLPFLERDHIYALKR
jgi:hypothetical protein